LSLALGRPLACGLEDGRIGVLYVGCQARSQPYLMMRSDPLFRIVIVPATIRGHMLIGPMPAATIEDLHRLVRLYMPRTYNDVVQNYDVIVFFEANVRAVEKHIPKLARAVSEGGLGLLMTGGWQSFGGYANYGPPWGETPVGPLLPTEDVVGGWHDSPEHQIVIEKPEHELMKSIPWDLRDPALRGGPWDHNVLNVKPGAELLARVVSPRCDGPLMVTWRLEGGPRTFSLASEGPWYLFAVRWRYVYLFTGNLMIYLDDRPVPQDAALVDAVRSKIFDVATRRSLLVALLDFCESFGANTQRITSKLREIDEVTAEALPQYLKLLFEDSLETYKRAEEMMQSLESEAMKLKHRALIWVYIIEWLAVTGTALGCGIVLWSLMIRRRLYREVPRTRLRAE